MNLQHKPHWLRKLIRHVAGWSCIVLGVLGCFLPILQGFVFLAAGAALLAPDIPFFRRAIQAVSERIPRKWKTFFAGKANKPAAPAENESSLKAQ